MCRIRMFDVQNQNTQCAKSENEAYFAGNLDGTHGFCVARLLAPSAECLLSSSITTATSSLRRLWFLLLLSSRRETRRVFL
jgi:hypothetical protein